MIAETFKVLIVEDDPYDADLLLRELKKSHFNFTSKIVETKESFENALENFLPDIILSDYSLPKFDGVSAFIIKQVSWPDIPFIIVSGTIGEERSIELIKNGVTDYALKDKLFSLSPKIHRALKDAEEKKEKRNTDEELKAQYEKLLEIAFMQSHQVRVPIANILGLFELFEFDNPSAAINATVLYKLKLVAESLDQTIHEITQNTSDIRKMIKAAK
ncbi:response regulator [Mucilaginibacter gotjawali]|uniref:DNA-binding NtrC family response regulator n=2 Tax=Mucilaginibacter gotjawali TaxID=1550579 RepID=A0A839S889_9SPHI|nr:response regulator [Mucilaginibacter gotjawali]MBB3054155.1 DNA-binding NtrC family response regulator [Mucilaginibacter gotjawali]BAU54426.1 DNA-binding transcriptional regulator BaeR [Mucilaginibacter gotjawali]